jgi:transcriptional regulator of arginine metabolism
MTTALKRRDEILRTVRHQPVHSQEELLELLAQRGHDVTQPTLSRDLRELGLVKTPSGYADPADFARPAAPLAFVPAQIRESKLDLTIRDYVVSAVPAGTMVVVKTPPAEAQPLARALDEADLPGVAGTLGGDDTVFVACTSAKAAHALVRRINSLTAAPAPRRRRA